MAWRWAGIGAALLLFSCGDKKVAERKEAQGPVSEYVNANTCAGCHAEIAARYKQTGMGRAFSRASSKGAMPAGEGALYTHTASGDRFSIARRQDGIYLQRSQKGVEGEATNFFEKRIDFVMGSGNHAKTFLHRAENGQLFELPLGWYAEGGGTWAMSPGFDRWDHPGFRRALSDECMFCHNAYPQGGLTREHGETSTFPAQLPEGIDCQRCHGPGGDHVEAASRGMSRDEIQRSILRMGKEDPRRQMELCLQCHLESTSEALPYAIRRFERQPYSYRPHERLMDFILHFDFPGGRSEHFEIAHAGYRLMQSACYLRSEERLTCTSCHDPHEARREAAATEHYDQACRQCHASTHGKDEVAKRQACATCHMPKRRTDDVVHVVMTDHRIVRRGERGWLNPKQEAHGERSKRYQGPVVFSKVTPLPEGADRALYEATAQVYAGSNLEAGARQLAEAIERHRPSRPEFYHQLAEALYRLGRKEEAAQRYRESLIKDPAYFPGIRNLGQTLTSLGRMEEAIAVLGGAPQDAVALNNLGEAEIALGRHVAAANTLRKALALDPDSPEALNNLGKALRAGGEAEAAREAWRQALRVRPAYPEANNNLANALVEAGDWPLARKHFEIALRDLRYANTRFNFGTELAARGEYELGARLLDEAIRLRPDWAEARMNRGNVEAQRGRPANAIPYFRAALERNAGLLRARLNLALAYNETGQREAAIREFRQVESSGNPELRSLAQKALAFLQTTQ